ncbi:MAG: SWIM zinc finger family protein [Syntrophorhabdaceae bacterium]|nr:SWIM zinc finger family protein [Syntrophorhabdaceae bacterium]
MHPSPPPFLDKLTFDILAAWAGEAVFQRGLAYHKAGKVRNLARTSEGGLLATVDGTRKYATQFFQEEGEKLASECTCPYGPRCKHAVAAACTGLALLAAKTSIPLAAANDKRLLDIDIAVSPDETSLAEPAPSPQALEAVLKKLSKEQLVTLMIQAAALAPEVGALCMHGAEPKQKDALALVKDARKAMRKALEVPDWEDYHHQAYTDYEPVRKKLEILRLAGLLEEVLDLALELLEDSQSQIEMYDDEGQTHDDIAQCMDIALQALRDVDWPAHKKLLWAADAVLTDDFAVCDCFWALLREKHPQEAWSVVADTLSGRLAQHSGKGFARSALVDMAIYALTEAGRDAEVLVLCKHEAVHSGEYLRLVELLLANGSEQEAEEWIHKGIAGAERKEPYAADRLRSCLLELRKKQKNWDAVLCMQTEDFVRHASSERFKECRRSAEKLKVWPALRPLLMAFLIERKFPWDHDAWPCQNRGKISVLREEKHPDLYTLIDLAIDEKNPAEVLKWYDLQRKDRRGYGGYCADRVAAAVQDFAPERAIALWKQLAEAQIALVKPKAYVEAASFLRKMGKLMRTYNMATQWDAYIQALRGEHRRRPRLMEVLDGLSLPGERAVCQDGQGKMHVPLPKEK